MNFHLLPRTERLAAIKAVMDLVKSQGIHGMAGECGELAVAMKMVLFDNKADLVAGVNTFFESHGRLVGHFVVRIDDEEFGCLNFDERGLPVSDEEVESWGMLDPSDLDWKQAAEDLGFEFTEEIAETAILLEFDADDVLENMPGSGVEIKIRALENAVSALSLDKLTSQETMTVAELHDGRCAYAENWDSVLTDSRDIAHHIEATSPKDIDSEYIEENFLGAGAVLRLVPIADIQLGDPDYNLPCEVKQAAYSTMPSVTRPPIVVEDNAVVDGNHRLRDAIAKGEKDIWCYVILSDEEMALQPEVIERAGRKMEPEHVYLTNCA